MTREVGVVVVVFNLKESNVDMCGDCNFKLTNRQGRPLAILIISVTERKILALYTLRLVLVVILLVNTLLRKMDASTKQDTPNDPKQHLQFFSYILPW